MNSIQKFFRISLSIFFCISLTVLLVLSLQNTANGSQPQNNVPESTDKATDSSTLLVYLFWGEGCSNCSQAKLFLNEMKAKYNNMEIKSYEVFYDKKNYNLLSQLLDAYNIKFTGVPVIFIGEKSFSGFTSAYKENVEDAIKSSIANGQYIDPIKKIGQVQGDGNGSQESEPENKVLDQLPPMESQPEGCQPNNFVSIPLIGTIDAAKIPFPLITVIIAAIDGFTPCAFFVLFSLLGLSLHARLRKNILIVGIVFIFFSSLIYFLFMSGWLNIFIIAGQITTITVIAGVVSLVFSAVNIKDFFIRQDMSLTESDGTNSLLSSKVKKLIRSYSLILTLSGTAILALISNIFELLCSTRFPTAFTQILDLNALPSYAYYTYLIFYNLVYVIPPAILILLFNSNLTKNRITGNQVRILKLISGTMMLGLGLVLIIAPSLLRNIIFSVELLIGSVFFGLLVSIILLAKGK